MYCFFKKSRISVLRRRHNTSNNASVASEVVSARVTNSAAQVSDDEQRKTYSRQHTYDGYLRKFLDSILSDLDSLVLFAGVCRMTRD